MKTTTHAHVIRFFFAAVLAAFLVGCASSRLESSRSTYIQSHDLDPKTKRAVADGRVVEGLPLRGVIASLGKYDRRNRRMSGSEVRTQLVYEVGKSRFAYVYLRDGRVTGWQNICLLPYSCR